jgi:hypothetical protein
MGSKRFSRTARAAERSFESYEPCRELNRPGSAETGGRRVKQGPPSREYRRRWTAKQAERTRTEVRIGGASQIENVEEEVEVMALTL